VTTTQLDWGGGAVTGAWDRPDGNARAVLLLAPGAGGDLNDALLRSVASRLAGRGVAVLRFNFPYREAGRGAPGSQRESEAAYRAIATGARMEGVPLFIGGKSYGGRMATHIAADGFAADGLVLLSYPLHPPGKFDRLRTAHLPRITAPMLFVRGTSDAFSREDLFDAAVEGLASATVLAIPGGDHSLRARGTKPDDIALIVADAVVSFVGIP
jgi:predicted alpha/beta-hydrolase family hydrolase